MEPKEEFPVIDLHCDTILGLWSTDSNESLAHNSLSIDVEKMKKGGVAAQCFALFVPLGEHVPSLHAGMEPSAVLHALHDRFVAELASVKDVMRQARTADDIRRNKKEGMLSAILTVEEGEAYEGRIEALDEAASWGVRISGLIWNHENSLGYPNSPDPEVMGRPLKKKGREFVERMHEKSIIVDVSHLNDGGFDDVADICAGRPFMATHSNSRSISNVCRNLTDTQIRTIADHGGVIGLNFCAAFLEPTPEGALLSRGNFSGTSRLEDMVRHVLHIRSVAGHSVLAMGTDFDGIGGELEIPTAAGLPLLRDALSRAGMSQSELDDMWENNVLRVLGK